MSNTFSDYRLRLRDTNGWLTPDATTLSNSSPVVATVIWSYLSALSGCTTGQTKEVFIRVQSANGLGGLGTSPYIMHVEIDDP